MSFYAISTSGKIALFYATCNNTLANHSPWFCITTSNNIKTIGNTLLQKKWFAQNSVILGYLRITQNESRKTLQTALNNIVLRDFVLAHFCAKLSFLQISASKADFAQNTIVLRNLNIKQYRAKRHCFTRFFFPIYI